VNSRCGVGVCAAAGAGAAGAGQRCPSLCVCVVVCSRSRVEAPSRQESNRQSGKPGMQAGSHDWAGGVGWGRRGAFPRGSPLLPQAWPVPARGGERKEEIEVRLPDITAGRQQGTRSRQPPSHPTHRLAHLCADKRQHIAVTPPLTADCHPTPIGATQRLRRLGYPRGRLHRLSDTFAPPPPRSRLVRLPPSQLPTSSLTYHPHSHRTARHVVRHPRRPMCCHVLRVHLVGSLPLLFKAGIGCMCLCRVGKVLTLLQPAGSAACPSSEWASSSARR
jgi:hypothetical protein